MKLSASCSEQLQINVTEMHGGHCLFHITLWVLNVSEGGEKNSSIQIKTTFYMISVKVMKILQHTGKQK